MQARSPLKGLLIFTFYCAKQYLAFSVLTSMMLGIAWLVTWNNIAFSFFMYSAVAVLPYIVLISIGGKVASRWEKLQISMPVKRKSLANAQYLSVLLASLFGVFIFLMVFGVGFFLHDGIMEFAEAVALTLLTFSFGTVMLAVALAFPIACTKIGNGEVGLTLAILISVGVFVGISTAMTHFEVSHVMSALVFIVLGGIPFVISLFITRAIYARLDF
ncbi:MAG: ABC-2 transporter permease [Defluviitaleaceae bacterium]|nr:ABC-2 transporter permease [Defluviitaleaceae bacterium]